MLPVDATLVAFHERTLAAHRDLPPVGSCAIHQWHYAVDDTLLEQVRGWHASGALLHTEWVDFYHDTPDGTLLQKHGARLRMRHMHGHSRRRLRHSEARADWSLRWTEDAHMHVLRDKHEIVD